VAYCEPGQLASVFEGKIIGFAKYVGPTYNYDSKNFQRYDLCTCVKDSMFGCWPCYWLIRTVGTLALFLPPFDLCSIASTGFIRPIRHFLLDRSQFNRQLIAEAHPWLLKKLMLDPQSAPNWTPLKLAQAHGIVLALVQELTGEQFDIQAILLQDMQAMQE